jgi:hypothetical protein
MANHRELFCCPNKNCGNTASGYSIHKCSCGFIGCFKGGGLLHWSTGCFSGSSCPVCGRSNSSSQIGKIYSLGKRDDLRVYFGRRV